MPLTPEQSQKLASELQSYSAPQNDFLASVAKMPQDQASKILRLSTLANIDLETAARNPTATVQNLIGASDFEDVGKHSPRTYSFLSDPVHMAITRTPDNVRTLSTLEAIFNPFIGIKEGLKDVARNTADFYKGFGDTDLGKMQPITKLITPEWVKNNIIDSDLLKPTEYKTDGYKFNMLGKEVDTAQVALDFHRMLPQVAAQMVSYAFGGPVASLGFMGSQIAGAQVGKLVEKDKVEPNRAFIAAVADATLQAPLEQVGLGKIFKKLPIGSSTLQKGREILEKGFTEGLTEFLQQYPEVATEIWAKNPGMTPKEMGKEYANQLLDTTADALYQGLVSFPLGAGGGAVHMSMHKKAAEIQAQQRQAVQQILAASELVKQSPELLERHLDVVSDNADIYIDPKAYIELQVQNPKVAAELGITPEEVTEAINQGGTIAIPASKYLVVSAQHPEIEQALKDDIATDETGITMRLIQEMEKEETDNTIAAELGLTESKEYSDAISEAKTHSDKAVAEHQNESNVIEQDKEYKAQMEQARQAVEEQVNNDPVYQASDSLAFNLQLFGGKNVKEVAQKYTEGKLSDEGKVWFETVAEQHGFSSGDELAKKIKDKKLKNDEVETRLNFMAEQIKRQAVGDSATVTTQAQSNEGKMKAVAMEAQSLRSMATGEHKASEAEYNARWRDAEQKLIAEIAEAEQKAKDASIIEKVKEQAKEKILNQKSKFEAKIQELKDKLADLRQQMKDERKQAGYDAKLAKQWLKAESVSQRLARQAQISFKEAVANAKETISKMPISEAVNWRKFMQQARNAAKKAEVAYRKGLYEEAAEWKDKELLNHALAIESVKVGKQLANITRYIKKQQKADKKTWKQEEHFFQAAELMRRFGYVRTDYTPANKTQNLSQWIAGQEQKTDQVDIAPWLENESMTSDIKDLTIEQLTDVQNALKNIKWIAQTEGTFLRLFDRMEVMEVANKALGLAMDSDRFEEPQVTQARERAKSILQQLGNASKFGLITPETLLRVLDNGKDMGFWWNLLYKPFYQASNTEIDLNTKVLEPFEKLLSGMDKKAMQEFLTDAKFIDEIGISLTKSEVFMIFLNWGNVENRRVLIEGRGKDINPRFKDAQALAQNWNEENLQAMLDRLITADDVKMAEGIWGLFAQMKEPLFAMHKRATGFEPKEVEIGTYTLRGQALTGGYFPLVRDFREGTPTLKINPEDPVRQPNYKLIATNESRTKQRTGATYPVLLDFNRIAPILSEMIHDIAYRETAIDMRRLLANPDLKAAINGRLGEKGHAFFATWMSDIVGDNTSQGVSSSILSKISRAIRRSVVVKIMGARLSVLLQTPASLATMHLATKELDLGDTYSSVVDFYGRVLGDLSYFNEAIEFVNANSAEMRTRIKHVDTTIRELYAAKASSGKYPGSNIPVIGDKLEKVNELSMYVHGYVDRLLTIPFWQHAYRKKISESLSHEDAVSYADMAVRRAFGSGMTKDSAELFRSNSEVARWFTMFSTFMSAQGNMLYERYGVNGAMSKQTLGAFAAIWFIMPILSEVLAGRLPDEDDDEKKKKAWWIKKLALGPTGYIPMFGAAADVMLSKVLGVPTFGYRPSPLLSVEQSFEKFVGTAIKAYQGNVELPELAERAADVASYTIPYPDQFNILAFNLIDIMNNGMTPRLSDMAKRRPKKERSE